MQEGKDYNFPKQEEAILQFWDTIQAFEGQLERSKGQTPYIFYDGPPFATGLPHYGHLLAGTIKVQHTSGKMCLWRHCHHQTELMQHQLQDLLMVRKYRCETLDQFNAYRM